MEAQIFTPELQITTDTTSTTVRCPVCNGPHSGAKHLPCQHSMCRQCLTENTTVDGNLTFCPQCEREHQVPENGVDGWKDDVVVTMDFGAGETDTFAISSVPKRESLKPISTEEAALPQLQRQSRTLNEWGYESEKLRSPLAVAVDINDDIYIAEFGAQQITVFNKNAQRKGVIKGEGHTQFTPTGVALNSRRQVVVTDIIQFRCMVFGRSGLFISEFGGKGNAPGQFLYPKGVDCHAGLVYVSDSKRIQVFRENGQFMCTFGDNLLSKPTSLAFSKTLIVVSDSENGIFTFDYKGRMINIIGEKGIELGCLRSPFGVTFDPDGLLVVANGFNHRVDIFKTNGEFVSKFAQEFFIVRSVAFLKHRRLVVVHGDRFQIFSTDSHPDVLHKKKACVIL